MTEGQMRPQLPTAAPASTHKWRRRRVRPLRPIPAPCTHLCILAQQLRRMLERALLRVALNQGLAPATCECERGCTSTALSMQHACMDANLLPTQDTHSAILQRVLYCLSMDRVILMPTPRQ